MRENDKAIWEQAKQHLNVRNNDEHTLFSYLLAEILLENEPNANADIVLPAIMLHDTGWSKIPNDKILHAFGPNNKYPELTRKHELESVAIAQNILVDLNFEKAQIEAIIELIDGHDTTKNARSLNDAIHKDADKLWRFTPHGNRIIGEWFEIEQAEVMDILENYVLPTFLTEFGKKQAQIFLKTAQLNLNLHTYL
jgi:HD superfamily phosphodiesterase